ncbi:MAG TPA: GNAT family N-acetyltransferase [Actinospica sp.]|nr:GNAT family N-acetyltransferase [Actinospica sp.]
MSAPEIRLDPMTEDEFAAWLPPAVRGLAEDKAASGQWSSDEALDMAKTEFAILLPQGAVTRGQLLYTVRDAASGTPVGAVWIHLRPKADRREAYIYDLVVAEDRRGKGYGRATMLAAIERARELGADSVGLHVFGHNTVARELYTSLGFVATNISMSLAL